MKNHIFFIQRTVRQQWDRNFAPDWYNEEHMAPFPLNSQRAILSRGEKYQQMSSCPKLSIVRAKFQENVSKNRGPLLLLPSLRLWDGDFYLGDDTTENMGALNILAVVCGGKDPVSREENWEHLGPLPPFTEHSVPKESWEVLLRCVQVFLPQAHC